MSRNPNNVRWVLATGTMAVVASPVRIALLKSHRSMVGSARILVPPGPESRSATRSLNRCYVQWRARVPA